MEIVLENISKKFGSRWVFKDLSYHFEGPKKYALIGSNGAGKSTLLKIIIGKIPFSRGKLAYKTEEKANINPDEIYNFISIATTSMSLIEEFTLKEFLKFHFKFRTPVLNLTIDEVMKLLDLEQEQNKFIRNFSSGMNQRLKIGMAILTSSSILILDEPGANLDDKAKRWYQNLLSSYLGNRLLIIASNDKSDYSICNETLDLSNFKK